MSVGHAVVTTLPVCRQQDGLIVEDDDSIRDTVGEALKAEGYEVLSSANGKEALSL